MTLSSVFCGNSNVLNQFQLVDEGNGGYSIKTNNTFACSDTLFDRKYFFNIQVDTISGGNTLTHNFQISTVLQNTAPILVETMPGVACGQNLGNFNLLNDKRIARFSANNGSASPNVSVYTSFLQWIIRNEDGTIHNGPLELRDPIQPHPGRKELWIRDTRVQYPSEEYNIQVIDGGGAVAECSLTFSINI